MNKNNMPRPHFCRGMDIANAEIVRLREAIKDRNDAIEAIDRENNSLREQNAKLEAVKDAAQTVVQFWYAENFYLTESEIRRLTLALEALTSVKK